jgi:hypothetical protein
MDGVFRPKPDAGAVVEPQTALLRLFLRDLQPLPPPDSLDALEILYPIGRASSALMRRQCWWPAISSLEAHSNRSLCDQSAHYEAIFEGGSAGIDSSGMDRSIAIIRSTQTPESTNCCAALRMKAIIIVWGKRVRENPSCDFFRAQPFDIAVVRAADAAHPSSSPSS